MSKTIPAILFLALANAPLIAQDADTAKAALETARKAAQDAGIDVPEIKEDDLNKLIKRASDELAKSRDKKDDSSEDSKEPKATKPTEDKTLPNVRIEALPAWIPAIPGFKPSGPGREWIGEKFDNGKLRGTSTESPASLVAAWMAMDGKGFSAERNTKTSGNVTTEKVRLTTKDEVNHWAEFSAGPGEADQPTQVRVSYSHPAPKDRPAKSATDAPPAE